MRAKTAILTFSLISLVGASCYSDPTWIRRVRGISEKYEPFILETISEESGHLIATASYGDYRKEKESHLPSLIKGVQTQGCTFWPEVKMQVSNNIQGEWKDVQPTNEQGEPATVTIEQRSPNVWLHLNLDAFHPLIGKFKYGKVILTNEQYAIFEVDNLLEPTTFPDAWSEVINLAVGDPLHKLPFAVAEIESMGEDLRAHCEYVNLRDKHAIRIEGTQTTDGTFWPQVIGQVADDYKGFWKTIGEPPNIGKKFTFLVQPGEVTGQLVVDVEIFRPLIGKFRYGRVVLKSGETAPFEMKNLLPHEGGIQLKASRE